ncbi:MAG TPA: DUF3108 domain-containing protein [Gemmatimonadales bacterium]|jgi:hypothetical protein|nr:DUF3108 domain-containing protein [Gemmatimonadales bacterium]
MLRLLTFVALAGSIASGRPSLRPTYPFKVGETLRYTATLGYFPVGEASLAVTGTARERGAETFVFAASGEGGPPGLGVSYQMTSWVGTDKFTSRRFYRRITQAGRTTDQRFIIIPDSGRVRLEGRPEVWGTTAEPLDELAFLYFLRTVPLQVGRSYAWSRYFHTGYNPVRVQVVGRETLSLPDGRQVPCLALRLTARNASTEVWLSDDARRLPVQLRGQLGFGEVTLRLSAVAGAR